MAARAPAILPLALLLSAPACLTGPEFVGDPSDALFGGRLPGSATFVQPDTAAYEDASCTNSAGTPCCAPGTTVGLDLCPGPARDLVLVVDNSGSMNENDPEGHRFAGLSMLAGTLSPRDRARVVTFHEEARLHGPFTSDAGVLRAQIDEARAEGGGGGTGIQAALYASMDLFLDNGRERMLMLLTDGDDEYCGPCYRKYAEELHVQLFALGFGPDVNERLLEETATEDAGFHHVATAEDIAGIYMQTYVGVAYSTWIECNAAQAWEQKKGGCP